MKSKYAGAAAMLAIAGLSVVSTRAFAEMTGPSRQEFVDASRKSCGEGMIKNNPKLSSNIVEAYCSCMAEAEADMTTDADVEYMSTHNAASADYTARVRALAPACKAKAGLK